MPTTESSASSATNAINAAIGKPPVTGPQKVQPQQGIDMQGLLNMLTQGDNPNATQEYDSRVQDAHTALDIVANATKQAVQSGSPSAIETLKNPIQSSFGKEGYESAKNVASQAGMLKPLMSSASRTGVAVPKTRPWQFKDPWGEFWLPALLGVNPGQIILSNAERQEKSRALIAKQASDTQWFTTYNRAIQDGQAHADAFRETTAKYGYVPNGAASLQGLSTEDRDRLFNKGILSAMEDPKLMDAVADLPPEKQVRMLSTMAFLRNVGETGYVPEKLKPYLYRLTGLEMKNVQPDIETELVAMGDVPPTPENVAEAQRRITERTAEQAGMNAYKTAIGQELAARDIFTGDELTGPIQREAARTEAIKRVEQDVQKDAPLSKDIAASLHVPIGTTMRDVINQKLTPLEAKEKDAIREAQNALRILDELSNLSANIHTDDSVTFFLTGIKRYGESFIRTNDDATLYRRFREGFLSVLARNAASERGVLNEGDVNRAKAILPGLIEKGSTAKRNFDELKNILQERIDAARKGISPTSTSSADPKADWIKKARALPANANVSKKDLSDYYDKKYGGKK